ncbi:MAG: Ig-like domain-containing protein [Candidatus Paceibacterota bacterium]
MRSFAALLCATAFLPLATYAATGELAAGFAPGSLWLSRTTAVAGDTVKLYTVVYNSSESPIVGTVEFKADTSMLRDVGVQLASGETKIVSADWTALAGSHSFSAQFASASSTVEHTATNSVSITVSPAPLSAIDSVSLSATQILASSSPAVQNAVSAVTGTAESWRASGTRFLQDALYDATTSPVAAQKKQVLGAETFRVPPAPEGSSWFSKLKYAVLSILLIIFRSAYLFYPFFAFLFLFLLYIARRMLGGDRR